MEIFLFKISDYDDLSQEFLNQYKKREISDLQRLRVHTLAYYLLDETLRKNFSIRNAEVEFVHKKPFLKSREKFFSISHSNDYIAIVISDYNCGIDIEYKKERTNYQKIAERMRFKPCISLDEFYKEWTLYEATYKLNEEVKSVKQFDIELYSITTVSSN